MIGVLHAGSEAYAQFVEDDARLLELIADRIALAINQASLYEAEQAAQQRLRFLGEAGALLGSSLDVEKTLEQLGAARRGPDRRLVQHPSRRRGDRVRLVSIAHRDAEHDGRRSRGAVRADGRGSDRRCRPKRRAGERRAQRSSCR